MIIGVDEAGRGCAVGPLIVAGVAATEKHVRLFKRCFVKDSKKLSSVRRESIFQIFEKQNISFHFLEISPKEIDGASLNDLEIWATSIIIKNLTPSEPFSRSTSSKSLGLRSVNVLLDVPSFGSGVERYCKRIATHVGRDDVVITGGNNMEEYHVVVAAASIVAKVIRDRCIEKLKLRYGNFGSGYPNARTVSYIQKNYKLMEPVLRKKWSTIKRIQLGNQQSHVSP